MTDVGAWLDARRPIAPPELRSALDDGMPRCPSGTVLGALESAAREQLDHALAHPGRVRASAFHLLAADALLTFGCEAALEGDEPGPALRGLVAGLLEAPGDAR